MANPEDVFAGDRTVGISTTGTFDGCPAGAKLVTESSFSLAMQHAKAGRRLLLRRTEQWTTSEQVTINNAGPGTIGAYGTGPLPAIHTAIGQVIKLSGSSPRFTDWRFSDFEFIGTGEGDLISAESTILRLLVLRVKASNYESGISIPANKVDYYGHPMHSEVAIGLFPFRPPPRAILR